jgi:hypothetical protein
MKEEKKKRRKEEKKKEEGVRKDMIRVFLGSIS